MILVFPTVPSTTSRQAGFKIFLVFLFIFYNVQKFNNETDREIFFREKID
jgi:hypothetical protein